MSLKSELDDNPLAPPIPEDDLQAAFQYRERFANEDDFIEALKVWPRCPECGKLRATRCPVCNTVGSLFPLGDAEFWDNRTDEERERDAKEFDETDAESCGGSCSCGSCSTHKTPKLTFDESERPSALDGELMPGVPSPRWLEAASQKTSDVFDATPEERRRATPGEGVALALCPVCAEAFAPVFARRCERCGRQFEDDGAELDESTSASSDVDDFLARKNAEDDSVYDADGGRMFWTILLLTLGAVASFLYFVYITR